MKTILALNRGIQPRLQPGGGVFSFQQPQRRALARPDHRAGKIVYDFCNLHFS